jgi:heme/copper-type cytochrome/quinol oxidase subunit 1
MMFIFLLISLAIVGFVALAAQHRTVRIFAAFYYLVQAGFAVAVIPFRIGEVESQFFTFDLLGAIFFVLMTVISAADIFTQVTPTSSGATVRKPMRS